MSLYDEIAEWYDAWLGTHSLREDPFFPSVEALIGDVAGQRVCDLACGQGKVARHLADLGAHVVGIDLSTRLLAIARRHEAGEPRGIDYLHADVCRLEGVVADGAFDGVLCHMALMDIAELAPALAGVARILRPGGWFVFTILHPCYNPPPSHELATAEGWLRAVSGYWDEGFWRSDTRTGPPGKVGSYHRTLSTYLNGLIRAGFALDIVDEPKPSRRLAEQRPVYEQVPIFFAGRAIRRG